MNLRLDNGEGGESGVPHVGPNFGATGFQVDPYHEMNSLSLPSSNGEALYLVPPGPLFSGNGATESGDPPIPPTSTSMAAAALFAVRAKVVNT